MTNISDVNKRKTWIKGIPGDDKEHECLNRA